MHKRNRNDLVADKRAEDLADEAELMRIEIDVSNTEIEKVTGLSKLKAYVVDFKINKNNKTIEANLVDHDYDIYSSTSSNQSDD